MDDWPPQIPLEDLPKWVGRKVFFGPVGANAYLVDFDGYTIYARKKGDPRLHAALPDNARYPKKGKP